MNHLIGYKDCLEHVSYIGPYLSLLFSSCSIFTILTTIFLYIKHVDCIHDPLLQSISMLLFNKQLHTGDKITIQNTKYKYANMEICKYAKYAKYKIQNTKYKTQNTKYKIQNTKYKIQNTKQTQLHCQGGVKSMMNTVYMLLMYCRY